MTDPTRRLLLRVREDGQLLLERSYAETRMRIGRSDDMELPLQSPHVSCVHAELELLNDGSVVVRDLASCGGVRVNGQTVHAELVISPGFVLEVYPYSISVEVEVQHISSQPEEIAATVPAGWSSLVAGVVAECCDRRYFLSRLDERGLKDQAGDDWRAGDEMVDAMNRIAALARDRALVALQSWSAPTWPMAMLIDRAIAILEALPDARHNYSRLGVSWVVSRLRARSGET